MTVETHLIDASEPQGPSAAAMLSQLRTPRPRREGPLGCTVVTQKTDLWFNPGVPVECGVGTRGVSEQARATGAQGRSLLEQHGNSGLFQSLNGQQALNVS